MPDSGMRYIDQNAARNPTFPLEPLFRALFTLKPEYEIGNIDLVTDRNNVRKLLRFVKGSSEAFRFEVEIAGGKTALFTRNEDKATEMIQGFKGYGHNFESAYTKKSSGSTGHHRVVSYKFGDLRCIVRHETDGYIDDAHGSATTTSTAKGNDDLSDLLEALSISQSGPGSGPLSGLSIESGGEAVDWSTVLEIKTRAISRELDMDETTSQLWVSQTPNLVVGYHRNGVFNDVRPRDMKQNIRNWEAANQKDLSSLACLMKKIITVVKCSAGTNAVAKYNGGRTLSVIAGEQERALPDDLYLRWEAKDRTNSTDKNKEDESTGGDDKPSQSLTTMTSPKTTIRIGDVHYDNDVVSKIPYLASFVNDQAKAPSESVELTHDPIPLFDTALRGIESGYRQCFRSIPADPAQHRILCNTYDFLGIDVVGGQSITKIINDLKSGKIDYDLDYGRYREIKGDKSKARDAAFKLLYSILRGELDDKDRAKIFDAVLFVVSHPATFKWRTRTVIRTGYEERLKVSTKQKERLDQWKKGDASKQEADDEVDATTEEAESLDWYNSDDSDYW
ncbi:MAG: hypothetical protein M1822_002269 [Bathelium mastoideum]|nr:MAG: hypothetical protein M1822_002269 [Bathelium mastoideum]